MVIQKSQRSNIMYHCKAFYIGSAVPTETKRGVEGLQQPLRERYRGNVSQTEGYDVTVTITPHWVYVDFDSDGEDDLALPISALSICAAVRCVDTEVDSDGHPELKFIPVHSVLTSAEPDTNHPAIFAIMVRRTEGQHVLGKFDNRSNVTKDSLAQ